MFRRFLWVTRWLFLALVCAGLVWLGWYGYTKGLGRHWRSLLEKEFARYGLTIDIGKITLDPFRGLIARDVKIFNNEHEESLLAEINQVSLDINYANLFQHEPALNSVDLSGASLQVPLNFRSPQAGKVRVTDFHARIYLLPGRIEVRQASAHLYGIRINAAATLIHPQNLSTAVSEVANDPDPSDTTVKFIAILFRELRLMHYPEPATSETADRKSTRLNSSHQIISYAVFCLKKKPNKTSRPKSPAPPATHPPPPPTGVLWSGAGGTAATQPPYAVTAHCTPHPPATLPRPSSG